MKKFMFILIILLLGPTAFAETSYPQDLPMTSGDISSSNYDNFSVGGENVAGVIGNSNYISGVGLAAMVFSPLLPSPGTYIPTVTTTEGGAITYPNPFNPDAGETTNIAYPYSQDVQVKVYIMDISGMIVRAISASTSDRAADGFSRVGWDGKNGFGSAVANGVYLVQIVYNGKTIAKTKIMVVR